MAEPGTQNLITDVPGIRVGQAEDAVVRTGVSVIVPDEPAIAAVAVAGGGPGTRETDLLSGGMMVDAVNAICLSGGSAFGLASADGVMSGLKAEGRGFAVSSAPGVPNPPIVPTAILYDLANGGDKDWGEVPPYHQLGLAAFRNAGKEFELGKAGAGYGAKAGGVPGGTGSASLVTHDGYSVGAIVGVNCFGSVFIPGTEVFWGWPFEIGNEFGGQRPPAGMAFDPDDWGNAKANPGLRQNTTIACIATDMTLTADEARRVAQMALSGFSRAIRPVFAPFDGDAVFVISTGQKPRPEPGPLSIARIGELAASVLTRSICRGVNEARKG